MRRKLQCIPAPKLVAETWPYRRARSFIMSTRTFAPVCDTGDTVYVIRSSRVRAKGGDYIMMSGAGDDARYVIVHIERPTGSTWNALTYGWKDDDPRNSFNQSRVRLSRAKWRPAYRCVGYRYTSRPCAP